MGGTAYDILSSFKDTFQGALGFLGAFLVIGGIIMLVIQWRMGEGGGGAAIAGGIMMVVAGIVIAIVAGSVGSLDIEWAH